MKAFIYSKNPTVEVFQKTIKDFNTWLANRGHMVDEHPLSVFCNFLKKHQKAVYRSFSFASGPDGDNLRIIDRMAPLNFNIVYHRGYVENVTINMSGISSSYFPHLSKVCALVSAINYNELLESAEIEKATTVLHTTSTMLKMNNIVNEISNFKYNG